MDPNMHVIWADGQEWIVKREDQQYFYRPEGEYGTWEKGTPPGIHKGDMDMIFYNNLNVPR